MLQRFFGMWNFFFVWYILMLTRQDLVIRVKPSDVKSPMLRGSSEWFVVMADFWLLSITARSWICCHPKRKIASAEGCAWSTLLGFNVTHICLLVGKQWSWLTSFFRVWRSAGWKLKRSLARSPITTNISDNIPQWSLEIPSNPLPNKLTCPYSSFQFTTRLVRVQGQVSHLLFLVVCNLLNPVGYTLVRSLDFPMFPSLKSCSGCIAQNFVVSYSGQPG